MKVSIITTFYNAQNFILDAINSINQQVVDDDVEIEYLLINDKSTDRSYEIAKNFVDKHGNEKI